MLKSFIYKYKKYIISLSIVVLSIVSIILQEVQREESIIINSQIISSENDKIAVYITGAVRNPGVYYLKIGSRLSDLIDICGGLLENADISKINLAKKLSDSDKVDIPITKEEIGEYVELDEEDDDEKVNINTASEDELMTLNGIGSSTAKKIIDYRKIQKFNQIEDIMKVPGIGESKYNNIKNDICI